MRQREKKERDREMCVPIFAYVRRCCVHVCEGNVRASVDRRKRREKSHGLSALSLPVRPLRQTWSPILTINGTQSQEAGSAVVCTQISLFC